MQKLYVKLLGVLAPAQAVHVFASDQWRTTLLHAGSAFIEMCGARDVTCTVPTGTTRPELTRSAQAVKCCKLLTTGTAFGQLKLYKFEHRNAEKLELLVPSGEQRDAWRRERCADLLLPQHVEAFKTTCCGFVTKQDAAGFANPQTTGHYINHA